MYDKDCFWCNFTICIHQYNYGFICLFHACMKLRLRRLKIYNIGAFNSISSNTIIIEN